ncbi:hypothetical protein JTB14_028863 [Gonioctena quinquepunctata]|nr:hypothetical protein JTB14_028863 [Gonioctena quinquepunctata]
MHEKFDYEKGKVRYVINWIIAIMTGKQIPLEDFREECDDFYESEGESEQSSEKYKEAKEISIQISQNKNEASKEPNQDHRKLPNLTAEPENSSSGKNKFSGDNYIDTSGNNLDTPENIKPIAEGYTRANMEQNMSKCQKIRQSKRLKNR